MRTMWNTEDDFMAFFITRFRNEMFGMHIWPKITSIGGIETRPELDLVDIDPYDQKIIGWEFKLVKRSSREYNPFYSGIGQALCYFRYGVDHIYLVVGFSEDISYEEYANTWVDMINSIGNLFTYTITNDRFGIMTYSRAGNNEDIRTFPPQGLRGKFPLPGPQPRGYINEAAVNRANLFALRYNQEKGRNFFRKYHLKGF